MMQEELSYWISFICQTCGFDDIASLLPLYGSRTSKAFQSHLVLGSAFVMNRYAPVLLTKCYNLQGQGIISIKNKKVKHKNGKCSE